MSEVPHVASLGIFVGGSGTRMGGVQKGLLTTKQGEALAARLVRVARELGLEPVLVGRADAYATLLSGVRVVADDPADVGPLGGLSGLLKAYPTQRVMAVACDMPHVSPLLLGRLASWPSAASVVAARSSTGHWEPLCARYDTALVLPKLEAALAHGVRSFQRLFATLSMEELTVADEERHELLDWDRPEDVEAD
jgi:molybdopterin-guanine dinucleotide biosynthesis protein A